MRTAPCSIPLRNTATHDEEPTHLENFPAGGAYVPRCREYPLHDAGEFQLLPNPGDNALPDDLPVLGRIAPQDRSRCVPRPCLHCRAKDRPTEDTPYSSFRRDDVAQKEVREPDHLPARSQ